MATQKYQYLRGHRNRTTAARKRLSRARTGAGNPFYGRKHTATFRREKSCQNQGERNPMFGVHRLGADSPHWRGGRRITDDGYVAIRMPTHPRAWHGYVVEHHLIAEQVLGRVLKFIAPNHPDNETAHHINFDRADNRNRNLLVCTIAYHDALHGRIRHRGLIRRFKELCA